jgi:hypothetical protein
MCGHGLRSRVLRLYGGCCFLKRTSTSVSPCMDGFSCIQVANGQSHHQQDQMSYQGFLVDVNKPLAIRGKALTSWKNGLLNSSKKTFHPWFTIDNVDLLSRDEFPSGLGITEEIWEECKLRVRDYMLFKNAYPLEIGTPAVQDTPPYVPVCKVCWYVHPVAEDSARHSFPFNADLWERAWQKIWWTDWDEESRMNRTAWWM